MLANGTILEDLHSSISSLTNDSDTISYRKTNLTFTLVLAVVFSLIMLIAILGNSLVIATFCLRPKLRKPSNYFILNLAVADLTLSILILPLSASYDILGTWLFGPEVCLIWNILDILVCTASILNLTAISADRYMAIR